MNAANLHIGGHFGTNGIKRVGHTNKVGSRVGMQSVRHAEYLADGDCRIGLVAIGINLALEEIRTFGPVDVGKIHTTERVAIAYDKGKKTVCIGGNPTAFDINDMSIGRTLENRDADIHSLIGGNVVVGMAHHSLITNTLRGLGHYCSHDKHCCA